MNLTFNINFCSPLPLRLLKHEIWLQLAHWFQRGSLKIVDSPKTEHRKTCLCNAYPLLPHFYNSQGARNLKIRSAQLTRQKRFDCIYDKNYPSTTFLGTSYGQIVVAILGSKRFIQPPHFVTVLENVRHR